MHIFFVKLKAHIAINADEKQFSENAVTPVQHYAGPHSVMIAWWAGIFHHFMS